MVELAFTSVGLVVELAKGCAPSGVIVEKRRPQILYYPPP
jgi:hypothetical protein